MYIEAEENFATNKELIASITLARTHTIGPITFKKLIEKYHSPFEALEKARYILDKKGTSEFIPSTDSIKKEIEETQNFGAEIINIFDNRYPKMLRFIEDAPITLSYKGKIENITENAIGFVGSRNCSANAVSLTYKFAKEVCENRISIISGLAKGIDASAHKGALDAESENEEFIKTVGVIGGGIDNIYPRENSELFERISNEGVIISEYPFGSSPKAENFPKRNRIISGLSKAICVVEAAKKSGSLITARLALEQDREVLAIPGFPLDPRSVGTNNLIKNGARLISSSKDLIDTIEELRSPEESYSKTLPPKQNKFLEEINDNQDNTEFYQNKNSQVNEDLENRLVEKISFQPTSIEYLSEILEVNIESINSILVEHEISGEILRHPGNKVSKVV